MNKKIISLVALFVLYTNFSFGFDSQKPTINDYYFKIGKSFDIFSSVFREITQNYVIEIDPEDLMNQGIEGMLNTLDPYTVFLNENESEDIDFISSGAYIGVGITVGTRNNEMTIIGLHDGYSAQKQGLRIGDKIYKVDSTLIINKTTDELRKYTKGKPGTNLEAWIIRPGINDTFKITLRRDEIKVKNVSYSGIIGDSIGYIKIEHFSRETDKEVRSAIYDLKRKANLKGIIVDLRDNPGGLLESAVSVCEVFLPENSHVLSTRGRNISEEKKYFTVLKPVEAELPLAILINDGSASASEIVAGAIQDLDRGVIVGERSFGKGLVQSVIDLPFKALLKITTSKYFTPSGRCIHRIVYDPAKKNKIDATIHLDSVYYTRNNRPVVESKGIIPDSTIKDEDYNDFMNEILKKNLFFDFATEFTSRLSSLPENFEADDKLISNFRTFLEKRKFSYKTKLEKKLEDLNSLIQKENISARTRKEFASIEKKILSEKKDLLMPNIDQIKSILDYEINSRFLTEEKSIGYSLKNDSYVVAARTLLKSDNYKRILSPQQRPGIKGSN